MIREISKTETYIPKFDGNRERVGTDQCVVHFKTPSVELRTRAQKRGSLEYRMDENNKFQHAALVYDAEVNYTAGQVLLDHIENEGYRDPESGAVKLIKRWSDLLLAPPIYHDLLKEICEEAERRLKGAGVDEKNSE